ncbi:MAG: indolepyruvate oxidoreductase subunit beta [Deltaproteobacteria bacterium]|nr:indolepyruvate oxidoreductase subunit beta [Deltaproteobacteria bacterium]
MMPFTLSKDPYNLIITGVGGQGNVLASRIIGEMLLQTGCIVTIGETFGASQRGGSVMSHVRISKKSYFSPQIPRGMADFIVALEPTEAIRVLRDYGNPSVLVISNTRPIHPIGVISGEQSYPSIEDMKTWIGQLSMQAWFIDATEKAMGLGNPMLGNIIAVGALSRTGVLPMDKKTFINVLSKNISAERLDQNIAAYDIGQGMIKSNILYNQKPKEKSLA